MTKLPGITKGSENFQAKEDGDKPGLEAMLQKVLRATLCF
jgi:hypothetical protein